MDTDTITDIHFRFQDIEEEHLVPVWGDDLEYLKALPTLAREGAASLKIDTSRVSGTLPHNFMQAWLVESPNLPPYKEGEGWVLFCVLDGGVWWEFGDGPELDWLLRTTRTRQS